MKKNTVFIKDFEENKELHPTLISAYENSKYSHNERIDFGEIVWDREIQPIADALHDAGVKEFTISLASTNLMDMLAGFDKLNYKVNGLVEVNATYKDFYCHDKFKVIPAILLRSM